MPTSSRSAATIPRVAIAHDYLTQRGGAEKVVLAMARAFPGAPIYTTLYEPESTFPEFKDLDVRVSPLNRFGVLRRHHRLAMPLLAFAVTATRKIRAETVLVSSSGWAHGFRTDGCKVVYCYSPARWLYQRDRYLGPDAKALSKTLLAALSPFLKMWDRRAAKKADGYLAISNVVRGRIQEVYGIESEVLPAPCTIDPELPAIAVPSLLDAPVGDFFLCVSRLLPYKNVDQIVRAFEDTGRRLIVVGSGPEESSLEALASSNVTMLKNLADEEIRWLYRHCKAIVAASYEDFGLTPLEAAAYGKPSAVLRWGGFLDTMVEGRTGIFFDEPSPAAIKAALGEIEETPWDATFIRRHASTFEESQFTARLKDSLSQFEAGMDSAPPAVDTRRDPSGA